MGRTKRVKPRGELRAQAVLMRRLLLESGWGDAGKTEGERLALAERALAEKVGQYVLAVRRYVRGQVRLGVDNGPPIERALGVPRGTIIWADADNLTKKKSDTEAAGGVAA